MNQAQIWPEGEIFIREVLIPTKYEPLPVEITYTVPAFDVVVGTWQNKDPAKGYALFRQFLVDWDQQDKLTDDVLIAYLTKWPGTDMAILAAWAEHMRGVIAKNLAAFPPPSCSLN